MPKLDNVDDYPDIPVSLVPTLGVVKTGEWRNMRPVLVEKTSPCTAECPAGVLIPHYFEMITQGNLQDAARAFALRNPFPRITGRVCPHFCETKCNRNAHDSAVSIRDIERFLGDATQDMPHPKPQAETGKSIAVVGSGPAGLSAAYYLRRAGHKVVVYEAREELGGMLRFGIPEYRLPNSVVDQEIDKLREMGIEFKTQTALGKDISLDQLKAEHQAVFVATGAWVERDMRVENEELVRPGLDFLVEINQGSRQLPGKRCAVVGGGNTAMDVARALRRLGAEVRVLYRRTENEMPAIPEEYHKAVEDGVEFVFLSLPRKIEKTSTGLKVIVEKMKLGQPDSSGRPRPEPTGETFVQEFDAVFKAVGEVAELSAFPDSMKDQAGWLKVNPDGSTGDSKVFVGGDMATGPATVVEAIAWGRRAAKAIVDSVGGSWDEPAWVQAITEEVVLPENTNPAYFPKKPRNQSPELEVEKRLSAGFQEESSTITKQQAVDEISRCFSCGHCNKCGTCFVFCPDAAINWGPGPEFRYDYCKGCGICPAECPGGVISFISEREM